MILGGACCAACERGETCESKGIGAAVSVEASVDAKPLFDAASMAVPGFGPAARIARDVLNAGLSPNESSGGGGGGSNVDVRALADAARLWARVKAERIYSPRVSAAEKAAAQQAYASWQEFQRRAQSGDVSPGEIEEFATLARSLLSGAAAAAARPAMRLKPSRGRKALIVGAAGVALVGAALVIRAVV